MTDQLRCASCSRESSIDELRATGYRCPCGHDQFASEIRGREDLERWAAIPGFEISTSLFVTWTSIAIDAARRSREAAFRLDPDREFGESLVACTSSSFAVDAFYGDVKHNAGFPAPEGVEGSRRHKVVLDGFRAGFDINPTAAQCARDLKWLYGLRNDAVHFKGGRKAAVRHHSGRMTPAEVAIWDSHAAVRSVDLILGLLGSCLSNPRDVGRVRPWVANVKPAFGRVTVDWPIIRALWIE